MQAAENKGTFELIDQAQETIRHVKEVADDLGKAREEVQQTVAYVRWMRFLGYDPHAAEFVKNLDLPN